MLGKSLEDLKEVKNFKDIAQILQKEARDIFRKEILLPKHRTGEITTIPLGSRQDDLEFFLVIHDISREQMVDRMKTEFVSIAAHQLRTPLSALKWALALLEESKPRLKKSQADLLEKMTASNERMIRLVNDLLNVARIEDGKFLYKKTEAHMHTIIKDVLETTKVKNQEKGISITFEKPASKLSTVLVDEDALKLALQNLVENAIQYTLPKGRVHITATQTDNALRIAIQDNGIGIEEKDKKRVFTKFFRGTQAIRLETEGSGLGLFIVKNIVEAHDGKVWFEPNEKKGTTFYIELPIKQTTHFSAK